MKVCLVGKYPPIEGGVSACTYWLARGLARRGHDVHVVTNADEVEERYRLRFGPEDADWYQPRFEGAGRVRVHAPQVFSRRMMGHIPIANPFVSKLAAIATDVVRQNGCDVILAYYYEPYAVAGWMASRWTGCPIIVKHAGSDLDRLYRVPDLSTTYREVLRSADAVVTQSRLRPRFIGMGVDPGRIERDIAYTLPRETFATDGPKLDIASLAVAREEPHQNAVAPDSPVIGIYGKVGITKGTFDLIAALGRLAADGLKFRLAAMIGEPQGKDIEAELRNAGILDRAYVLPLLPNWRVPEFLRTCSVVCFLERDFPVAIHGPVIPREVMACGSCLVLSREIASKQRYRDALDHGRNCLIVEDPKDHDELTSVLRRTLSEPQLARNLGAAGAVLSVSIEGEDRYASEWEALLSRHSRGAPVPASSGLEGFEWVMPDIAAFLRAKHPSLLSGFADDPSEPALGRTMGFLTFAAERLRNMPDAEHGVIVADILDYARERLQASYYPPGDCRSAFGVVDCLQGEVVSLEEAGDLRPLHGATMSIKTFDHDVTGSSLLDSIGGHDPVGIEDVDLSSLPAGPVTVLFHRSPNLIPCELRIDPATVRLIQFCDGTLSLRELVNKTFDEFNVDEPEERSQLADRISAALDRLYRAGVLVFGEWREGWGWTGGERSTSV